MLGPKKSCVELRWEATTNKKNQYKGEKYAYFYDVVALYRAGISTS